MSPQSQLTSRNLKEIILDEQEMEHGGREVQKPADDKEVLNPDNSS